MLKQHPPFRGQWHFLLGQSFFRKQGICELGRSFTHPVPESWSQSHPPAFAIRDKKDKMSQRGSFTEKVGPCGVWDGACNQHQGTQESSVISGESPPSLSEKIPEVPSPLWRLWHRILPVPKGDITCHCDPMDPPPGFQIPFMWEKSDWAILPDEELFEIDGNSVSNSRPLPGAPLLPPQLFCHSQMKERS